MDEYEVISIPVSDGSEREFAIMDRFEVEGKQYIAVSLVEEDEIQEGVYLYRITEVEDESELIETIDTPAEYKKVVRAYEKLA